MTFSEFVLEQCENNGMFPKDAAAVLSAVKADSANESMKDRWNDDTAGYPPQMRAVMILAIRRAALAWIDAHCPQAWYRPMFDPEQLAAIMEVPHAG